MSEEKKNVYVEYAEKAWNGALEVGEKYGLPIFGLAFIVKELVYPIVKIAVKAMIGADLP